MLSQKKPTYLSIKTGIEDSIAIYERVYQLDVLDILSEKHALVSISCYDKSPSSYKYGDSDQYFGDFKISLQDDNNNPINTRKTIAALALKSDEDLLLVSSGNKEKDNSLAILRSKLAEV